MIFCSIFGHFERSEYCIAVELWSAMKKAASNFYIVFVVILRGENVLLEWNCSLLCQNSWKLNVYGFQICSIYILMTNPIFCDFSAIFWWFLVVRMFYYNGIVVDCVKIAEKGMCMGTRYVPLMTNLIFCEFSAISWWLSEVRMFSWSGIVVCRDVAVQMRPKTEAVPSS